MLKKEIIKYLENPSALSDYSLSELSGILKKYPYFQTAYLLFVLNLKNIKDPRFKEYLEYYSVCIKDRERLFQHLNIIESYSASYFEGIKPSLDPATQTKDETEEQSDEDKTEDEQNANYHDTKKKQKNKKILPKETKEFSTEYLRSRIAKTLTQQANEADSENQSNGKELTDFFILDKADELTERVSKNVSKEHEGTDLKETESKDNGNTYSDEMFELDESSKSANKRPKEINETKYASDQYFHENVYNPEKKQNKDLIDQFLEKNPEIEKIEPKKEDSRDISENSVQEREELLTEKLALLYVKQGYFEKAIEAYQKLSLKYPEKSDYFAKQIERVKQLNNEQ